MIIVQSEKLIQFGKVGKVQAKDPGLVLRITIIVGVTRVDHCIRESQTFHSLPVVRKCGSKARIWFTGTPALQINSHVGGTCPCTEKILQRIHYRPLTGNRIESEVLKAQYKTHSKFGINVVTIQVTHPGRD
jgi:hypothetical protein